MEEIVSEILSSSPIEHALITFDSEQGSMRTNGMVYARQESLSSVAAIEVSPVGEWTVTSMLLQNRIL